MNDLRGLVPTSLMQLKRTLGVSYSHLWRVLTSKRRPSAELSIQIEIATNNAISRGMLRPDLWPVVHEKAS